MKPDFVAPGHFLASEAAPQQLAVQDVCVAAQQGPIGQGIHALSGTSMSAAVVTGVVALLEAGDTQARALTPNLAKGVLQFTAIPLKDETGNAL